MKSRSKEVATAASLRPLNSLKLGVLLPVLATVVICCCAAWLPTCRAMTDQPPDPSCPFNPLCTCSGSLRNFRSVQCASVPLSSAPLFNASLRLSHLLLDGNGLRVLDEARFVSSGLERLHVVRNLLTRIPEAAFSGVTRTLKELDLSENQLCTIPRRALKPLQVLRRLNLNDNDIVEVRKEDLSGLESSLEQLSLARNRLSQLPADVFADLRQLELLDLSGNLLTTTDATSFRGGLPRLTHLLLADNMLDTLPRAALLNKKSLRTLDLSGNCMTRPGGDRETNSGATDKRATSVATLDHLVLNNNQIRQLEPGSLLPFATVHRLSINNNPLTTIANGTFGNIVVRELHLENCDLSTIAHRAFSGLELELRVLNLANNRLTDSKTLASVLVNMTALTTVNLTGNSRLSWLPTGMFANCSTSIKYLQMDSSDQETTTSGGVGISAEGLQQLQNLRNLSISKMTATTLRGSDFPSQGLHLDRLSLRGAGLQAINADAFKSVTQISHLTLDANRIGHLNEAALTSLADSLETLDMNGALTPTIDTLPVKFLQPLASLQRLHLSNNRLKRLPADGLRTLTRLRLLNLQDNVVDVWPSDFLTSQHNPDLYALRLSFNQLKQLDTKSFFGFKHLRYLYLDDNLIATVRRQAVANLETLEFLDLQGNRVSEIENKAFQDLPNLRLLNLARNRLTRFPLDTLDSVATSMSLEVDLSHNRINNLTMPGKSSSLLDAEAGDGEPEMAIVAVEVLRLSHNNISSIRHYFRPLIGTLIQLHLDHNAMESLSRSMVGDLSHLQLLRLDYNRIRRIDSDSLLNCGSLQVLQLDHNRINTLPAELLSDARNLRHLDLSSNHLDSLPDTLFRQLRGLEYLNLASNIIARFPTGAMWSVALTLRHLDMSTNKLFYLENDIFHTFEQLLSIDLSNNDLKQLDESLFSRLPRLHVLKLAFNNWTTSMEATRTFAFSGGFQALEELDLSGCALTVVPPLDMPHLLRLNLSTNAITSVPATALRPLTKLRHLDLASNRLPEVPADPWVYMSHLQFLSLSRNPIRSITNASLLGLNQLNELHIEGLPLESVDAGFLGAVKNLRTLRTSAYQTVPTFKMAALLRANNGLTSLCYRMDNASKTTTVPPKNSKDAVWPCKLRSVSLSGRFFKEFSEHTLGTNQFQSRTLRLRISNSSVTSVPTNVWKSLTELNGLRYFQLDLSVDGLNVLADPRTVGESKMLEMPQLRASGDRWRCDCGSVGWVERWMRQRRLQLCGENESADAHRQCRHLVDDVRPVLCGGGGGNRSLVEVLKTDLDCGLVSAATSPASMSVEFVAGTALVLMLSTFLCS